MGSWYVKSDSVINVWMLFEDGTGFGFTAFLGFPLVGRDDLLGLLCSSFCYCLHFQKLQNQLINVFLFPFDLFESIMSLSLEQ